jgi:hypothetical protein
VEVSFGGTKYWRLESDDAATIYAAPQWKDVDGNGKPTNAAQGERDYAVAFTRNTKPQIGAKFKIASASNFGAIKIKATGPDGVAISETAATMSGDEVTLPLTEASSAMVDTIKFYDKKDEAKAFKLKWEIKIGDSAWAEMPTTKHTVYVTLNDPVTPLRQETLFYYACHNPSGNAGTDGKAVTRLIYQDFATKTMARIDGTTGGLDGKNMTFYPAGLNASVVKDGTGDCIDWAEFFRDALKVHAYTSVKVDVMSIGITLPDGKAHNAFWLVNDQTVTSASSTSNGSAVPGPGGISKGQGNGCSHTVWAGHRIARAFGEIYDPSYGIGPCADEAAYEAAALPGFLYTGPDWLSGEATDKYIQKDAVKRLNYTNIP